MEAGPASDYAKGLKYLAAARRISIASRGLDAKDADLLRKQADQLTARGLGLLKQAVRPPREAGGAAGS